MESKCEKLGLTIKVIGPGGCIGDEIYLINKILTDNGYEVEIKDHHPPEKPVDIKNINGSGWKVTLIAEHQPWGG